MTSSLEDSRISYLGWNRDFPNVRFDEPAAATVYCGLDDVLEKAKDNIGQ